MVIEVNLKKWGNSFGIILPKELIDKEELKENSPIFIEVVKKADLSDIFGSIQEKKISGQEFKNMIKRGWRK